MDTLSVEALRPKDSVCLDLFVPDGKYRRVNQVSQKCSGMSCFMLLISYSLSGYILSWRNMEPHFLEWIGLPVIFMPWRPPPWH